MREARIECVSRQFDIPELGLALRQGGVKYVPEGQARASRQLEQGRIAGAVSVRYVERYKVSKENRGPAPPAVRMSRPNMGGMIRPPKPVATPEINTQEIAERAAKEAADAAAAAVEASFKKMIGEQDKTAGISQGQLEEALRNVLPGLLGQAAGGMATPVDDTPVLIPEGIVNKDAKASVTPSKTESDDVGLGADVKALKAARKKPGPKKDSKRAAKKPGPKKGSKSK